MPGGRDHEHRLVDLDGLRSQDREGALCVWGDHSTVASVTSVDIAAFLTGKSGSLDEAAATAAKLRNDVRVKI